MRDTDDRFWREADIRRVDTTPLRTSQNMQFVM
jgi:hypothetical protein